MFGKLTSADSSLTSSSGHVLVGLRRASGWVVNKRSSSVPREKQQDEDTVTTIPQEHEEALHFAAPVAPRGRHRYPGARQAQGRCIERRSHSQQQAQVTKGARGHPTKSVPTESFVSFPLRHSCSRQITPAICWPEDTVHIVD
ncbi:expressed unknown protein [Seminavis robusta]|uniref:Uncharacterized protein n=1 Tax=Seminavis robusta TaxID=568900 RepID=A0A9N8HEU9_9STRA|nr:expressed unknown protein [Seminavis robusta]|eukprot:Sro491_g153681.1  (143) ;mRNA; f:37978-38406